MQTVRQKAMKKMTNNFDDDDENDNDVTYEKKVTKQIKNKKRKESVTI